MELSPVQLITPPCQIGGQIASQHGATTAVSSRGITSRIKGLLWPCVVQIIVENRNRGCRNEAIFKIMWKRHVLVSWREKFGAMENSRGCKRCLALVLLIADATENET